MAHPRQQRTPVRRSFRRAQSRLPCGADIRAAGSHRRRAPAGASARGGAGAAPMPRDAPLRAVEFYCGIGGLHYSLQRARPHDAEVVASYDVNPLANDTYALNFGRRPSGRDIRALRPDELDAHAADLWLLSPPCQPYTRNGLRKDADDGRADSFACLLAALGRMARPPARLLLENVVGFDTSRTREAVLAALTALEYRVHEFCLSPVQLGVPYSRPRYFLLAARAPGPRCALAQPLPATPWPHPPPPLGEAATPQAEPPVRPVREYYDACFAEGAPAEDAAAGWARAAVPWPALRRSMLAADFVHGGSTRACCFTKSYGRYAKGTGSLVLRCAGDVDVLFDAVRAAAPEALEPQRQRAGEDGEDDAPPPQQKAGRDAWPQGAPPLRYFTPAEVARLHGFPASFAFPEHVTTLQRYALLGNSLSVDAVAPLLTHLLADL